MENESCGLTMKEGEKKKRESGEIEN